MDNNGYYGDRSFGGTMLAILLVVAVLCAIAYFTSGDQGVGGLALLEESRQDGETDRLRIAQGELTARTQIVETNQTLRTQLEETGKTLRAMDSEESWRLLITTAGWVALSALIVWVAVEWIKRNQRLQEAQLQLQLAMVQRPALEPPQPAQRLPQPQLEPWAVGQPWAQPSHGQPQPQPRHQLLQTYAMERLGDDHWDIRVVDGEWSLRNFTRGEIIPASAVVSYYERLQITQRTRMIGYHTDGHAQ